MSGERRETSRPRGAPRALAALRGVEPASMSHPGSGSAVCMLPYTTTHVEFEVFDIATQQPVLEQRFPAAYTFVAAP